MPPKEHAEHFIVVRHKKYPYTINKIDDSKVRLSCSAADLSKIIDNKHLAWEVLNLPNKILEIQKERQKTEEGEYPYTLRFRVSKEDKDFIEKEAFSRNYPSVSAYLRSMAIGEPEYFDIPGEVRPYGHNRVGL